MALISSTSRCAICNELLGERPYLATSGVFFPEDDPLYPYCDAPLHWDCYEVWDHRSRFARQHVASCVESDLDNEYWGNALLTDRLYVSVRKKEPGIAVVWLFEIGTDFRVPLTQWSAWPSDPSLTEFDQHPLEYASLEKVLPQLRQRFPDPEAVLAGVDWQAKERLAAAKEKENARREQSRLEAIRRHNNACRDFIRTSGFPRLPCAHCSQQSSDIEFVDYTDGQRRSFFVCPACGRSFGHDL
jgi:hypothetical protein